MDSKTPEEHYRRLSEAVDLYLRHREDPDKSTTASDSSAEIMKRHPELADLLEPLLESGTANAEAQAGTQTQAERDAELESPRFFGDYELLREVGRGGMGVVFDAMEVALQRRVALKLLANQPGTTTSRLERFRREAAAAGRLQHPGIATVHRVGQHGDTHFIAMELVDGPNLATVLAELRRQAGDGPYQVRNASLEPLEQVHGRAKGYYANITELVARVAEALAYAHDHGVVHRDVKPHNILLGGPSGVKLVDFGLAKDFDRESVTRTGDTAGTPEYMSPEQVRGEPVDPRTDVYSLGVVLYELLTWERPFSSDSIHATLSAILHKEPSPIRRLQPQTPRDLATICNKAMEKDPARRYPSAATLAEDLLRFCRHEPILATPPSAASRAVKLVRRNRAISVAAVFAMLALVVAPISFAFYFKQSRDALNLEQLETARQRDLASNILTEARAALDDVYSWLATDRLANEPGMGKVRRELLERAGGFYERFIELAGDEPMLQWDAMLARFQLSTVTNDLAEHERAHELLQSVLTQLDGMDPPPGKEFQWALQRAHTHSRVMTVAVNRSDMPTAEAHEAKAVSLLEQMPTATDEQWQLVTHELAHIHAQRSRRLTEYNHQPKQALKAVDHAIELWQSIVDKGLAADKLRTRYASALSYRGLLHCRGGDPELGVRDCERALGLLRVVAKNQPSNTHPRLKIAETLQRQAEALTRNQDFEHAIEVAKQSIVATHQLHRDFPASLVRHYSYASALFSLAITCSSAGDARGCLDQLELAWPVACALVERANSGLAAISLMGNIAGPLASLRRQLDDASSDEILPLHERAVALFEASFQQHPKSGVLLTQLATALSSYGNDLQHAGQMQRAQDALTRSVDLYTRVIAKSPVDAMSLMNARVAFVRLIACQRELGELSNAHKSCLRFADKMPDAESLYQAAKELARSATVAAIQPDLAPQVPAWRDLAMQWLDRAIRADFKLWQHTENHPAFEAFTKRDDFQALAELARR